MNPKPWIAAVVFVLAAGSPALAQADPAAKYLELLRGDVRAEKIAILTEALDLTEAQGTAFWPIYREYDTELAALGDRRVEMVKKFVATYDVMTEEEAGAFARKWMALQEERMSLRHRYFGKVAKATSNKVAARFVQVENAVAMLIDLQIAAEAPLLK